MQPASYVFGTLPYLFCIDILLSFRHVVVQYSFMFLKD